MRVQSRFSGIPIKEVLKFQYKDAKIKLPLRIS